MRFLTSLLTACAAVAFASCTTISSRRIVFPDHPISLRVMNKVVDEENIDHVVKFRNIGQEILSFDYTIADEPGVPHVDASGPNSGWVKNLYPGEEREVPNPVKRMGVYVTLGTVTYGKKPEDVLQKIYRPDAPAAGPAAAAGGAADLFGTPTPAMP